MNLSHPSAPSASTGQLLRASLWPRRGAEPARALSAPQSPRAHDSAVSLSLYLRVSVRLRFSYGTSTSPPCRLPHWGSLRLPPQALATSSLAGCICETAAPYISLHHSGRASVSASVSVTISISLHRSSLVSSHSEALSLPPSDSGRVSASSCLSGPHSCPSLVLLRPWWALGHHRCHTVEPRLFASLRSSASMTVSSLQAGVVPCVLGA